MPTGIDQHVLPLEVSIEPLDIAMPRPAVDLDGDTLSDKCDVDLVTTTVNMRCPAADPLRSQ